MSTANSSLNIAYTTSDVAGRRKNNLPSTKMCFDLRLIQWVCPLALKTALPIKIRHSRLPNMIPSPHLHQPQPLNPIPFRLQSNNFSWRHQHLIKLPQRIVRRLICPMMAQVVQRVHLAGSFAPKAACRLLIVQSGFGLLLER